MIDLKEIMGLHLFYEFDGRLYYGGIILYVNINSMEIISTEGVFPFKKDYDENNRLKYKFRININNYFTAEQVPTNVKLIDSGESITKGTIIIKEIEKIDIDKMRLSEIEVNTMNNKNIEKMNLIGKYYDHHGNIYCELNDKINPCNIRIKYFKRKFKEPMLFLNKINGT